MSFRTHPAFQTREELDAYLDQPRIECLECGKRLKKLGVHLRTIHGIEPDAYREKYGIPYMVGLACPETRDYIRDQVSARMNPARMKELQLISAAKRKVAPNRRMNDAPIIRTTDRSNTDKMRAAMPKNERDNGPSEAKRTAFLKNIAKATERNRREGPTERQKAARTALGKTWGKISIHKMLAATGKKKLSIEPELLATIFKEREAGVSLERLSQMHGVSSSSLQRLCAHIVKKAA